MYAGGKDTEGVEDGPDSTDMEEDITQEIAGASHYSAKFEAAREGCRRKDQEKSRK